MNLEKLKADALAAKAVKRGWRFVSSQLEDYPALESHLANCDPQTILKMIAVIEAVSAVLPQLTDTSYRGDLASKRLRDALEVLKS